MIARLIAARRGLVAAEFAVCGALTMLVLMFVLEVGLMSWTKVATQAAAAAAARCAAIGNTACASVPSYAVTQVGNWLFSGAIAATDVTVQSAVACNGASGKYTVVTINSTGWAASLPANLPAPLNKPAVSATSCFVSGM